jgi:transposase-like protein
LPERRRRAEAALVMVVATSYLPDVLTRRMEKLVATQGNITPSRSLVGEMARDLDAAVETFRTGRWTPGRYTLAAADALVLKVARPAAP